MVEPALQARDLTKRFGGLIAVDGVSLSLERQRLHAVIGPNGAGKSTLTNLLAGELAPTAGTLWLAGRNVTGAKPDALARLGLGRSFQRTNILAPLTVWENVRLAAQARAGGIWRIWQRAERCAEVNARAERALELAGLQSRAHRLAGAISHGEQRQLEIAMTLATEPTVLLLDEPLAGMGSAEAERMIELLLALKRDHALMLVEHDMDAVFALADELTVMVNGRVIAHGAPQTVRADAAVQAAYLGEEA
ncbi:MAG: ABC transporter ATP-binding protein [Tepidimonas sp.]|uniref:ABC transporter ATP-binding protein n=1 Tax=Tepidimonas sp. TaxID=2002775 RepID=UPI00298F334E|nr:ABC transporter ATP-binding protein [Tepidimonas sp.]MCS6810056.1 ABC transporter ATP-binding protein [Tepidimonas sp.]MDW8337171.1 ABC transporter ATP-binding protein [Tepidimonas sp.]